MTTRYQAGDLGAFMNDDLCAALPHLLPSAVAWAEERAAEVSRTGITLDDHGFMIARRVGVSHPEQVRIALVAQLPFPSDPELRQAALATGLLGPNMAGLTLGYAIFICR